MMAVYVGRKVVSVCPLDPTEAGCYVKIVTMHDPAVDLITISCNGSNYVSGAQFGMSQYGYSWFGELHITGLDELKYYEWTASQAGFVDVGSVNRLPREGERHTVLLWSCDNNTNLTNQNNNDPQRVAGLWGYVRELIESGVFVSMSVGIDDVSGYVDGKTISDDYDANSSGLLASSNIQSLGSDNDASLAWLSWFGCLGTTSPVSEGDLTDNKDLITHWGREENRAWCRNRLAKKNVAGDHEAASDHGYITNSTAGGNPWWDLYQLSPGVAQTAFRNYMTTAANKICNGAANDAHANHWTIQAGGVKFIAFDHLCNAAGGGNDHRSEGIPVTVPAQMSAVYGGGQLADAKAEMYASNARFKILCLPSGLMYMADGNTSIFSHLAQYPLLNHCRAEFESLFTNNVDGMMRNRLTNGTSSVAICVSGDLHRNVVSRLRNLPYAGNDGLNIEHWSTGTINGSFPFSNLTGLAAGDSYESSDGIVKADLLYDETSLESDRFSLLLAEDMGDRLRITSINTSGKVVIQRDYIPSRGNNSYSVDANISIQFMD